MDETYEKNSVMLSKYSGNSEQELSKEFTGYDPRNDDMPFDIPILQRHNKPRHETSEKRKRHFSETVNMVKIGNETRKAKRHLSATTQERGHLNTDRKRKHRDGISHDTSSKNSFEMALCSTIPSRPKQRKSSENECHGLERKHIITNTKSHDINTVATHKKSSSDKCNGDSKKQTIRNNEKSFGIAMSSLPSDIKQKKSSCEKQCQEADKRKNKTDLRLIKDKHAIKRCTVDVVPLKMCHNHCGKDLHQVDTDHKNKKVLVECNKHCHSKAAHQERYKSVKSKVDCGLSKNDRTLDKQFLLESAKHNCNEGAISKKARNIVIDEKDRQCNRTVSDNSAKCHDQRQIQPVKDKYHDIKAVSSKDEKSTKTGANSVKGDVSNVCNINFKYAKPNIDAEKCVNNDKLLKILKDFNLMDKLPIESLGDHDVKMDNKISAKERSASVGNEVVTERKVKIDCLGKHRSNSGDESELQIKKIKTVDSSTVNAESESSSSKNDSKASDKYLDIMNYWKHNIGQKKMKQNPFDKSGSSSKDHVSKKTSSKSESVHRSEMRNDGQKKSELTMNGKDKGSSTRKKVVGKESESVHSSEMRNDGQKKSESMKEDQGSSFGKEVVAHSVHRSKMGNVGTKKNEATKEDKESSTRKKVVSKESDSGHRSEVRNDGQMKKEDQDKGSSTGKEVVGKELSKQMSGKGENNESNHNDTKRTSDSGKTAVIASKCESKNNCKQVASLELSKSKALNEKSIKSDTNDRQIKGMPNKIERAKECRKKTLSNRKDACKNSGEEIKRNDETKKTLSSIEHNKKKAKTEATVVKGDGKSEIKKVVSENGDVSTSRCNSSKSTSIVSKNNGNICNRNNPSEVKRHITKSKADVRGHKSHISNSKSEYNNKKPNINKNINERSNSKNDVNKEKDVVGNSKGFEKIETNKGSPIKKKVAINWKKCTQLYKQQQQQRRGHHLLKSLDANKEDGIVRNSKGDDKIKTNKAAFCKDKNKVPENSMESSKRHYLNLFTSLKSGLNRLEQEKQSDRNGDAAGPTQTNSERMEADDDSKCSTKEKASKKDEKIDFSIRCSHDNLFESLSRKMLSNDGESKKMTSPKNRTSNNDDHPNGEQCLIKCKNDGDVSFKTVRGGSINVHQPQLQHTKRRWHSESGLPTIKKPQKTRHSSSGSEATKNTKATIVTEIDGDLYQADLMQRNDSNAAMTSQMETMCKDNSNIDVSEEHAEDRLTIDDKKQESVMFRHLPNMKNMSCDVKYKDANVAKDDSISLLAKIQDILCVDRNDLINAQSECQTSVPRAGFVTETVTAEDSDSVVNLCRELLLKIIDIPKMPATSDDVQDDEIANVEIPVPQLLENSDASMIMQDKSSVDEFQNIALSVPEASLQDSNDGVSNCSNGGESSAEGTSKSTDPVKIIQPMSIGTENIPENIDATLTNNAQIAHSGRLENSSANDIGDFHQHNVEPTVDTLNSKDGLVMTSTEEAQLRNTHYEEDTRNYVVIEDVAIISNEQIPIIGIDDSIQDMDSATLSIKDDCTLREKMKQPCASYRTAGQNPLISSGKWYGHQRLSCKETTATLSYVNISSCHKERSKTAGQDKPCIIEDDLKKDCLDGMFNLEYHNMKDPAYVNASKDEFDADSENDTSTIEYRELVDFSDCMSNEEKDYNNKTLRHHSVLKELIALEKRRGSISTDVANVISCKNRGHILDDDIIVVNKTFIGINVSSDKEYINLDEYIDIESLSEHNTTNNSSFMSECSHLSDDKQCCSPDASKSDLVNEKSEALKDETTKPEENDSQTVAIEKNSKSVENCKLVTADAIKNASYVIVDLVGSDSEDVGDETVLQTASRNQCMTKQNRVLSEEHQNAACEQQKATAGTKNIMQRLEYNDNTNCEIRSCEKLPTVEGHGLLNSANTISSSDLVSKPTTLDYGRSTGESAKDHPDIRPRSSSSSHNEARSSAESPSSSPEQKNSQCGASTNVVSSWHRPSVYNPNYLPEEKYPEISGEQKVNKVKTSDIYSAQNVITAPVTNSDLKANTAPCTTIVCSPTTSIHQLETQCSLTPKVVSIASFAKSIDEPIEISDNSLPANDIISASQDRCIDNQQPVIQPTSNEPCAVDCIFKDTTACSVSFMQTKCLQSGVTIQCYGILYPRTTKSPHWTVCCTECRRIFPVNDFMQYHHHNQDVTITRRYIPHPALPMNAAQQLVWYIYLKILVQKGLFGRHALHNFLQSKQSYSQDAPSQPAITTIPTAAAATQNISMNQKSSQRSCEVLQTLLPMNQGQAYPSSNMPPSQTSTVNNSCMFQSKTKSQRPNYPSDSQSSNLSHSPLYTVQQPQMLNSGQNYPASGPSTIQTNSCMQQSHTANQRLSYAANATSQQNAIHPSTMSMPTCLNPRMVGSFQNVPYNSNNLNPGHPNMANRQNDQTLFSKQNHLSIMASQACASWHVAGVNNIGEPVSRQPSLVNSCAPYSASSETNSVTRMNNNSATLQRATYPPAYRNDSQISMPLGVPIMDRRYSRMPLPVDYTRNSVYYKLAPTTRRRRQKKINNSKSTDNQSKTGKVVRKSNDGGKSPDSDALDSVSKVTNGCLSTSVPDTVDKETGPLKTSRVYTAHDVPPKRHERSSKIHSSISTDQTKAMVNGERKSTGGTPTDTDALGSVCICDSGQAASSISKETDMSKVKDSVDKDNGPLKTSQVHTVHAKTYVPCSPGTKANESENSLKSKENCIMTCSASKHLHSLKQLLAQHVGSDTVSMDPSAAMDRFSAGTVAFKKRVDTSTEERENDCISSKCVASSGVDSVENCATSKCVTSSGVDSVENCATSKCDASSGVDSAERDKERPFDKGFQIDGTSPAAADSKKCNESANTVKDGKLMMALHNDKPSSKADDVTEDAVTKLQEDLEEERLQRESLQAKFDAMKAEMTELRHIVMLKEEGK